MSGLTSQELVANLLDRAKFARLETTATAKADAWYFEKAAAEIKRLHEQLAKSCDDGRFEDMDWACPRAAKAEAETGRLRSQLDNLQGDYSHLEACNKMNMEEGEKLHKQLGKAREALGRIARVFDESWFQGSIERSMGDLARSALTDEKENWPTREQIKRALDAQTNDLEKTIEVDRVSAEVDSALSSAQREKPE